MKKKPRFFCDNCGTEVERNTKSCPRCGRFFASVLCPKCGHAGEEKSFAGGCPACGYSAPPAAEAASKPAEKKVPAGPLRLWVYIISIAAFVLVFMLLLTRILH